MFFTNFLFVLLVSSMAILMVTAQGVSLAVLSPAAGAAACTQFITVRGNIIENCLTEVITVAVTVTSVAPGPSSLGVVSSQTLSSVSNAAVVPPISAPLPSEEAISHRTPTAAFILSTSDIVSHRTLTAAFISSTSDAVTHLTPTAAFISSTSVKCAACDVLNSALASYSTASGSVPSAALSASISSMPTEASSTSSPIALVTITPTRSTVTSVKFLTADPSGNIIEPSMKVLTSTQIVDAPSPTPIETMPLETFSNWEEEPEETGTEASDDTDTEGDEDPTEDTEEEDTGAETSEEEDSEPMRLLFARVPVVPLVANSSIAVPSATLSSETAVTHRTPTAGFISSVTRRTPTAAFISSTTTDFTLSSAASLPSAGSPSNLPDDPPFANASIPTVAFFSSVTRRTPTAAFISSTAIDSILSSAGSTPSAGSPSNLPDDPPFANASIPIPSVHVPETFLRSATIIPVNWNTSSTTRGSMVVKTMTVTNTVFVNPPSSTNSTASIVNSTSICHSAAALSTSLAGLITQIPDGQIQGPVPTTMSLPPGAPSGVPQGVPQGVPEGISRGLPSGWPHPGVHSVPGNATITKAHGIPKPSHFSMPPHSYRGNTTVPQTRGPKMTMRGYGTASFTTVTVTKHWRFQ
ncbi:hypothetical protein TI39_contig285g00049 [Zymoseptoria brevis]|uniref:Uncharacterized protein n=1 Tax=Zymoseptoria brevis TaxID=1047168 RepID=A0A0F4GW03_9PEZI|nr:hypothetical protein TI39_contig285g00049 [Zymoseptoria brevis]